MLPHEVHVPHQSKPDSYYPDQNCKNEALVINFSSQKTEEEKAQHPSIFFLSLKNTPSKSEGFFSP